MPRGLILAIESSCDETAAAVVQQGSHTLSSVVGTQISTHARYGGVVPELASREHLRAIVPVVRAALAEAKVTLADLDAIAVTSGPGLAGALLVGITYAKALAFATGLPLIAVNHLEGHIHAVLLNERESAPKGSGLSGNDQSGMAMIGTGSNGSDQTESALKGAGINGSDQSESAMKCTGINGSDQSESAMKGTSINGSDQSESAMKGTGINGSDQSESAMKGTGFSPYIERPNNDGALAPEGNHPQSITKSAEPIDATTPGMPQGPGRNSASPPDAQSALALVVSGGHTHLYLVRPIENTWRYTLIGRTLDDAAGEAFDKVAKLLGLGYPGGPWIDALALHGNPHAVPFAFAQIKSKTHLRGAPPRTKAARSSPIANLDPHFLFSFSGIKTAVLRYVELHNLRPEAESRRYALFTGPDAPGASDRSIISGTGAVSRNGEPPLVRPARSSDALRHTEPQTLDLIASFQRAVVGDLMKKTFLAAESLGVRRILVTGGVAANRELRSRFTAEAARLGLTVSFPTLALSTDNAAMIAAAAWPKFLTKSFALADLSADPAHAL